MLELFHNLIVRKLIHIELTDNEEQSAVELMEIRLQLLFNWK